LTFVHLDYEYNNCGVVVIESCIIWTQNRLPNPLFCKAIDLLISWK